jgi:hypothetical protein
MFSFIRAELRNFTAVLSVMLIVFLSGIITPAKAQGSSSSIRRQITPFNLFYLAYQGYFKQDDIDGGNQAGNVDPKMLVQAAIKRHWLSEQTASNKAYLRELNGLINGFNIGW